MTNKLYVNERCIYEGGTTFGYSEELTFVSYSREEVLPRIDKFIKVFKENSEVFGCTESYFWLTDYPVYGNKI